MIDSATFATLLAARGEVARHLALRGRHRASGPFLPYTPSGSPALTYIGQATRGAWHTDGPHTLGACLRRSHDYVHCDGALSGARTLRTDAGVRFWRYLDLLCGSLLGGTLLDTRDRWAWTNLLKIGAHNDAPRQDGPGDWGRSMRAAQRPACVASLRTEIAPLEGTVIVVASLDDDGMIEEATGHRPSPHPLAADARTRWWRDTRDNLWVQGPHPRASGFGLTGAAVVREIASLASRPKRHARRPTAST